MDFIHASIVFEILSRAPLKTLCRSKSVSKEWNHIIYEPNFIQLHMHNTNTIRGYYIQSMSYWKNLYKFILIDDQSNCPSSELSLDYLPGDSKILASSNQGIICFMGTRYRKNRFYVCKPSTRQVQALPNPKLRYLTEKVALVVLQSNPLRYKIIRLSCPKNYDHKLSGSHSIYRCEIFHSKTWAWKESKEILLPYCVFLYNPTIFANGAVHWLTTDNQILAFDVNKETCTIFPLPEFEYKNEYDTRDKQLVKYKAQIGIIWEAPAGHFELWVMENYKNHAWRKIEVIKSDPLREKEPYCLPCPAAIYNSETALMKGHNYAMFYNFGRYSSIKVAKLDNLMRADEVFAFRSDLEPVDLKGRA